MQGSGQMPQVAKRWWAGSAQLTRSAARRGTAQRARRTAHIPWRFSQIPHALHSVPWGKWSRHQRGVSPVPQCTQEMGPDCSACDTHTARPCKSVKHNSLGLCVQRTGMVKQLLLRPWQPPPLQL